MKEITREPKNEPSAPKGGPVKFHTKILEAGKTATGIQIPDEVVEKLGAGKRPPVRVTINGQTYRSTVAVMAGKFMVGVSAENRAKTGVAGGDAVDVEIELDTQPREVAVPADFAQALKAIPTGEVVDRHIRSHRRRGNQRYLGQAAISTRSKWTCEIGPAYLGSRLG